MGYLARTNIQSFDYQVSSSNNNKKSHSMATNTTLDNIDYCPRLNKYDKTLILI